MPQGQVTRLAVLADRIGWEERRLLDAARAAGIEGAWLDDGRMCASPVAQPGDRGDLVLLRSKSFVRGPLLAGVLEDAGARVVNGAGAATVCSSKLETLRRLHAAGVPAVPFRLILTRADLDLAVEQLGLPLVLKPIAGGLGRRVLLARDADLVNAVYDYVEHHARGFERALLAQPLIEGRDVRIVAVAGQVVAAMTRVPDEDWRANVATGAGVERYAVDDDLRALVERVTQLLDVTVAGIDVFATESGYCIGEVNHVPEFRGAATVCDVDVAHAIIEAVTGRGA